MAKIDLDEYGAAEVAPRFVYPEADYAALEARCRDLTDEVRYLRTYGNKDCTAMADAARASSELETK